MKITNPEPVVQSELPTPNTDFPPKGRLLGIDYGTVRVGVAACDVDRIIATPMSTYARRTVEKDTEYFKRVKVNEQVVGLVVGLPISLNGTEGPSAIEARAYGAWLASVTGLPLRFWDERFTSSMADDAMIEAGLTKQKRKEKRDRVAAQMMLQSYLDAGCPAGH